MVQLWALKHVRPRDLAPNLRRILRCNSALGASQLEGTFIGNGFTVQTPAEIAYRNRQRRSKSRMPSITPQPSTSQQAITQDADGRSQLVDGVAVPLLLPGNVLVKTTALALNPSDYKMGAAFSTPGAVVGMDFAETVVCIAEGTVTDLVVGDVVCAAVHGSNPAEPDNGSFAEYVRVRADMRHGALG